MANPGGFLWLVNKLTKGVFVLLALALMVTLFIPLFRQSQRLSEEKFNLEQQIKVVETENKRLQEEAMALASDPRCVERVAREKMGWAKPDEKVTIELGGAADLSETDPGPLSVKRAEAVKAMLVTLGVDGSNVTVTGYGSDWARVRTTEGASEAKNRRVQVRVIKAKK